MFKSHKYKDHFKNKSAEQRRSKYNKKGHFWVNSERMNTLHPEILQTRLI